MRLFSCSPRSLMAPKTALSLKKAGNVCINASCTHPKSKLPTFSLSDVNQAMTKLEQMNQIMDPRTNEPSSK